MKSKVILGAVLLGAFVLGFFGMRTITRTEASQVTPSSQTTAVSEDKTPEPAPDKFKTQEEMMAKVHKALAELMDNGASADGLFRIEIVGGPKGVRYLKVFPNDGSMDEFPRPDEDEESD